MEAEENVSVFAKFHSVALSPCLPVFPARFQYPQVSESNALSRSLSRKTESKSMRQ